MGMIVAGPAGTIDQAKHLAAEHSPDVAVVDINLRGEMAYGLIDWLHDRCVRVVIITGYSDLPDPSTMAATILHKPFSEATLLTTLRQVMEQNRGH